jgi:hypothetical protein
MSVIGEYLEEQKEKNGYLDPAELYIQDRLEVGALSTQNLWTLLKKIRSYEAKALPGNYYWKLLENKYGYQPDFVEADHGNQYEIHNS